MRTTGTGAAWKAANGAWLRRIACLLVLLLGASSLRGGRAADPQPYTIAIAPTGNQAVDTAVHDAATLISLQKVAAVGPFALLTRARNDQGRFATVLQSFGYYAAKIAITVAGRPLGDPNLPGVLDATPAGQSVPVAVAITPGPLFHVGKIELSGDVPAAARATFGLKPGDPAVADEVLAARDRLLQALLHAGHALATVSEPVATLHTATQTLDIAVKVEAGPRVDLGPIAITGLQRTHEAFVRRILPLRQGEPFDPVAIEAARKELAGAGAFATVRIDAAAALDAAGQLPMAVKITERPLRSVALGGSYSTDLGGNLSATWTHHNLFGNSEQLVLTAAATNLGGTASLQPGYNLSSVLTVPDWRRPDQSLILNLQAIDQWLQAYTRRAELGGVTVERKLNPDLTASVGVEFSEAHIVQEDVGRNYTLLEVPLGLRYDTTGKSLDPTHGVRANLSVTPTQSFQNPEATFVIAQASGSTYLDFGRLLFGTDGRSVLAARALVGGVEGASTFDIPPDQRFYAGGGGSVRGYRFQSVGPQFADTTPTGGTSVDTGSIELRQRIGADYGVVAFVDAGQVGTNGVPFAGTVRVGAGVGARYYTAFGPLRLDVAVPLTAHPGSDAFELYLGIGQAF